MPKLEPRTYETVDELERRLRGAEAQAASLEGTESSSP
jgi:hypothetical protein